jgi:micrococcal nuclease
VRRALVPAILLLAACSQTAQPDGEADHAVVTRVVDGDTVEVRFGGRELDVRLIGIDTPESVRPDAPVGCFGPEASAYTSARLEGVRVRLEFDVERLDRFGRTLAYVWLGDELLNETLLRRGYALVTTFPPNVRYVERFRDAQRLAREEGLGLWSACP